MLCKDAYAGFSILSTRAPEMDSSGHSSTRVDRNIDRIATPLTHAACEWFLIFLMFVDALLSYLLVWFASYCRLQLPCFLCSKLHRPFHWRLLLCRSHRSEVSSFISCHIHDNNLADSRGMCDDCLLSFTKSTGPNPDMHRLLLGKLGYDLLLKSDSVHRKSCSCCDKPWRSRHGSQRLIRLGFRGRNTVSKPNIPTPRNLSRRGSGNFKKMKDQKMPVVPSGHVRGRGDGMAHVGYTELKITSDSESEFPFSDEDAFIPITDFNIDSANRSVHESQSEGSFGDKSSKYKTPDIQDNKNKNTPAEASMAELILLDDIQQQSIQADKNATVFSEFTTLADACPTSSNTIQEDSAGTVSQKENDARTRKNSSASDGEIFNTYRTTDSSGRRNQRATNCPSGDLDASSWESKNQAHDSVVFPQEFTNSAVKLEVCEKVVEPKESEFIVEHGVSGSVARERSRNEKDGVNGDSESLTSNDVSGSTANDGVREDTVTKNNASGGEDGTHRYSETLISNSGSGSVAKDRSNSGEDRFNGGTETLTSNNVFGSVAKEHSSSGEEGFNGYSENLASNNVSGFIRKERSGKDEDDTRGDSEPLTSCCIHNEESLVGDKKMSSRVIEAPSTSKGTPELKHSASLESFGSVNSDFEGESLVDRLKQQVEYDRQCLKDLHKELEEERNAADIAANQAMAMITRLQEEKAALHMEALQYLRMMDEQAEHDVDALEKANDLLADKEKEIQDLEMELEYYRLKFPDESRDEIIASMGISANKETRDTSATDENTGKTPTDTNGSHKPSFSTVEIEKESLHISQRLRNLEMRLYQFAKGRLYERAENGSFDDIEVLTSNGSLETEEESLERYEDGVPRVNGEPLGEENNSGDPIRESKYLPTETAHRSLSKDKKEWITMEKEISELKKSLETLEADRDFLEQAFVTLEKGREGVELIEEIARELQELRNLGIRR